MGKEERTIESIKAENEVLKKRVEELEDVIKLKKQVEEEEKSNLWSSTLSQDEIDDIVSSKIAQEMLIFFGTNDIAEIKMIELVLDFVLKDVRTFELSDDFKTVLSLGHRTYMVLGDAIFKFMEHARMVHAFEDY